MKKQAEFIHRFNGFGVHASCCQVKVWKDEGTWYVLFVDIDEGTSVTNASEQLATDIVQLYELDPDNCRFFETYSQYADSGIDEVTYTWTGLTASAPQWQPAPQMKQILVND